MQKDSIYILHIESSTDHCSVSLSRNGEYLYHITEEGTLKHAEIITVLIDRLLKSGGIEIKDLSAVALSEGPGSYTSLRVGMSAAKGICYGQDIPLISINTLEALAYEAKNKCSDIDLICAMIDARRMEVYASLYDKNMHLLIDNKPLILVENTFDNHLNQGNSICLCGNGSHKVQSMYTSKNICFSVPECDARYLIRPAFTKYNQKEFSDLAYFSPNYIKSPHITKAKKKLL